MAFARHHDLAVRLNPDREARVGSGADRGRDDACAAPAGVQRAVAVVAHHGEVAGGADLAAADDHDLAVSLNRNASGSVVADTDGGTDFARAAPARVQRSIGVVASD